MEKRDYQQRAIDAANDAKKRGVLNFLLPLPTGAGKGNIAGWIAKEHLDRGENVLFVIHKKNLIADFRQRFRRDFGIFCPIWQNGAGRGSFLFACRSEKRKNGSVMILATPQTLASKSCVPLTEDEGAPDLAIWDEAHHVGAESWTRAVLKMREKKPFMLLGMTATPSRISGKGLARYFDEMAEPVKVSELIELGFLVPVNAYVPDVKKVEGMKNELSSTADDYTAKSIEDALAKENVWGDLIENYKKHAYADDGRLRKGVVFCRSIAAAEFAAQLYSENGVTAVALHSDLELEQRQQIMARLRGEVEGDSVDLLVTVDMVSEGFDLPELELAILLAPTKSLARYLQWTGRIMRPSEGKTHGILIDHVGNVLTHGLPNDDRKWTLDEGSKGKKKKEQTHEACITCGFVNPKTAMNCEGCGRVLRREVKYVAEVTKEQRYLESGLGDLVEYGEHKDSKFYIKVRDFREELNEKMKSLSDGWKEKNNGDSPYEFDPYRPIPHSFAKYLYSTLKGKEGEKGFDENLDFVIYASKLLRDNLPPEKQHFAPKKKRCMAIGEALAAVLRSNLTKEREVANDEG